MKNTVEIVTDELGYDSYNKGLHYNKNYLRKIDDGVMQDKSKYFRFDVESESYNNYYDVVIIVKKNEVVRRYCSCLQYQKRHTCKHIAACMLKYQNELFKEPKNKFELSSDILKDYVKDNSKEQVHIKIELDINDNTFTLRPKIGTSKYYLLNTENKLSWFKKAYLEGGTYNFGINFTYDSKKHYFSKEDEELVRYIIGFSYTYYGYSNYQRAKFMDLNDRELLYLFKLLENKEFFIVRHGYVKGVKYEAPSDMKITLNDDHYELKLDNIRAYDFLGEDYKFAIYDGYLYVLPKEYSNLLKKMKENEIDSLYIKNDSVKDLVSGLLKDIKKNVTIDERITDIVVSKDVIISFYFDLKKDVITCDLKMDYDGTIINYFSQNTKILRDDEKENEAIELLRNCNFDIDYSKKRIELTNMDDIALFIDEKISLFSSKYKVYTTKKLDNVNILKKSKVESNFSIGKDNIMTYNFKADNIDTNELNKIVSTMKNKKRYYKLKNGNIVDLYQNDELKELTNVLSDLDLSKDEIINGNVSIPKYRAFYINSLKENKYKSITTNYSFDKFINDFLKYKNTNIKFDNHDDKTLRDYQKDGVKWLYTLYKCDLGGILADEMGLGKSIQTISFIKQILSKKKDAKIMIVCPTSLVYNWKKEFDKFAKELKYVTVSESKEKRLEIIKDFDKYNIFITSYGLIRNDNDEYEDKTFELCVIDEAQAIKNYQANMTREVKKIKARTKIALTGTPIENSVLELWSIFDFIMPGYLNSIMKFKEKFGIKDFDDDSLEKIKELNYLIKPFILRRKKKDVSKELPDKVENNVYLELPDVQKALYVKELNTCKKEMDELIKSEGFSKARFKILQLLTKLRQICVDPSVMYENYKYESIKVEKLVEIVKDYIAENHKILIFSSFKRVIENVQKRFDKEKISNYLIAGDVTGKKRMELVDKFNGDDTSCFLITLKSGGTGLNLTSADIVIHLDVWWNPQVENQATDRAHRIGQKNKVTVIKMITKGTIEERIIELQDKKKMLSDNLIEGKDDSSLVSKLDKEDMIRLLSYDKDE